MRTLLCVVGLFTICWGLNAEDKPTITLAEDGFPTGQDRPEGAACDLSRAFIKSDVALLKRTCLAKYGGGETGAKYAEFLKGIVEGTEGDKKRKTPHPKTPKRIAKVFAARHLSMNGPSSYGYSVHGFQDVMFVDIGVFLSDGSKFLNRTMVVKEKDGKWYVHPCPTISSLLSAGLNEEKDSKGDFRDKYNIIEKKVEQKD